MEPKSNTLNVDFAEPLGDLISEAIAKIVKDPSIPWRIQGWSGVISVSVLGPEDTPFGITLYVREKQTKVKIQDRGLLDAR